MKEPCVSIVIPCFNEEGVISSCLDNLSGISLAKEIIVIDDGSKDKTARIVTQKSKELNIPIELIRLSRNYGKAKAVRCGINAAKGEIIIIHDADMIINAGTIEKFYCLIKNNKADIVIGSRFVYPRQRGAIRISNLIGNKLMARSFSFLMGQKITDVLCGLKAFRKGDFLKMKIRGCRWGDLDMLIGAKESGLRVVEVPVYYFKRKAGISKMRSVYDTYLFTKQTIGAFHELKIKGAFLGKEPIDER